MELPSGWSVWFRHRHRHHPEDTSGGCSTRGRDSYPATSGDLKLATTGDLDLATSGDFYMAMDICRTLASEGPTTQTDGGQDRHAAANQCWSSNTVALRGRSFELSGSLAPGAFDLKL
jgi:hypothetical protein